jgi:hypothetical protein
MVCIYPPAQRAACLAATEDKPTYLQVGSSTLGRMQIYNLLVRNPNPGPLDGSAAFHRP